MRRAQWLAAAICVLLALGGCNDKNKDGAKTGGGGGGNAADRASGGLASARELVEAEIRCTDKLALQAKLQLVEPDYRQPAKLLGEVGEGLTTRIPAKFRVLADALEQQSWGRPLAPGLRKSADSLEARIKDMANRQIAQVYRDGRIDWTKIDLREDGDGATATWPGRIRPLEMIRLDGRWYLLFDRVDAGATPQEALAKAQAAWRTYEAGTAKLDDLTAKVKQGVLNKQQYDAGMAEWSKLMVQMRSQVRQ